MTPQEQAQGLLQLAGRLQAFASAVQALDAGTAVLAPPAAGQPLQDALHIVAQDVLALAQGGCPLVLQPGTLQLAEDQEACSWGQEGAQAYFPGPSLALALAQLRASWPRETRQAQLLMSQLLQQRDAATRLLLALGVALGEPFAGPWDGSCYQPQLGRGGGA